MPATARLVLPFAAWPEIDQQYWEAGLARSDDDLDGPSYADTLQPTTLRNSARAHGRFLAVLLAADRLDPQAKPAKRIFPANARIFLAALRGKGNTNNSIITRFFDLQSAMLIMHPEQDFSWLTAPRGESLRSLLPVERRRPSVVDARILFEWGHELMEGAATLTNPLRRAVRYRNGLLIAILAARAPRLRTIAAPRLGKHVLLQDGTYQLVFGAGDVKNRRPIEYPVPSSLVPCMDHYVQVERQVLLQGQQHDWFWVSQEGTRLQARGIEGVIRRGSQARFGMTFGPHRFRHALATTVAMMLPGTPGLGACLLGVTIPVVAEHYNLANQMQAGSRFNEALERERQQTNALAARLFR